MEKENQYFREEEQCVCDGKPCSCSTLKNEISKEEPVKNSKN